MEQYLRQGLISDSKVLDIRQVDVGHQLASNRSFLTRGQGIGWKNP